MTERPRVVVTGMGCVTPLGGNLGATWTALLDGTNAFEDLALFDVAGYRGRRAAACPLPGPPRSLSEKASSRLPRAARLLLPAFGEALAMAGLAAFDGLPLSFSTTAGGMEFGEEFLRELIRHRRARFAKIARYHPQQQMLDVQRTFGFEAGPTFLIANSCASGANAIGHALDWIQSGRSEVVVTGGFEAINELVFAGFDCLQAQTTEVCRPFDVDRSGLLLGEAAACLVLETAAHALRRGARPLAVVGGYGHSTDTHHITQPAPTGAALVAAIHRACGRAGIAAADLDYVNAHGTGTPANDPAEWRAYEQVFGETLAAGRPQIRSTKAAIGHTLGAAGAIEAIFAVQTLRTGAVPPQIGLRTPLPGSAAALRGPSRIPARWVASTNLGFGGSNAALVLGAP
jgi:3-oxoacyl-[acyl-carrier-protein] synthase II